MRLEIMRLLYGFLFSCLLIFAGGCIALEDSSRLEPAADTASGLYQPGSLVRTKFDATTVAGKLFEESGGIKWTASPEAVLTEQLSYAEAVKWIGVGDGEYERWGGCGQCLGTGRTRSQPVLADCPGKMLENAANSPPSAVVMPLGNCDANALCEICVFLGRDNALTLELFSYPMSNNRVIEIYSA